MTGEVVPIGKYRGQPVEVLAADPDYREWLVSQPWFAERYRNTYNIVVNYGGESQDSPEHNEMQARLLDDDRCFALFSLLHTETDYGVCAAQAVLDADPLYQQFRECLQVHAPSPAMIAEKDFEVSGWDVVFTVVPAAIEATWKAACGAGRWGGCRRSGCPGSTYAYGSREWQWLSRAGGHRFEAQPLPGAIRVELKPDVGDDFPAVLRQVKGFPFDRDKGDRRVVVARRCAFEYVNLSQVQMIFATAGVDLVMEASIGDM